MLIINCAAILPISCKHEYGFYTHKLYIQYIRIIMYVIYCIAGMFDVVNVWRIAKLKVRSWQKRFGEWMDLSIWP